jgi:hypothetical protein
MARRLTPTMSRPAVAWFTRRNYPQHRALDPIGLPLTFDEWLFRVAQPLNTAAASARVVIDPAKFSAWCRAQGREPNASARAAFAQIVADGSRSRGWWHRRVPSIN